MWRSIQTRLTISYIGLAIIPLLLFGLSVAIVNFQTQRNQALSFQNEVAGRVAAQVEQFIRGIERDLLVVTRIQDLHSLALEQQKQVLTELILFENVFEELFLLDETGQELLHVSRLKVSAETDLVNRAEQDAFVTPATLQEVYYSSVYFDEEDGEPFITIAVPLIDQFQGTVAGVLVAEVRFRTVWNLMRQIQIREGERVFVTDLDNQVVAARVPSIVLQGTKFETPTETGFFPGLDGEAAVVGVTEVVLNNQSLIVVSEQLEAVALRQARLILWAVLGSITFFLLLAGGLAITNVQSIVRPIQTLVNAAETIRSGDLSPRIEITTTNELGTLGDVFNEMADQLQESIGSLESRIAARTKGLESVANIAESVVAILDVDELMVEVIRQIEKNFDYYHAHIYLLDEQTQNLVVAEGMGEAGAAMKARRHHIPLAMPNSLVARAARTRQVMRVDNVRESKDWLPNELLPNTHAEMAVPIILEDQVVGVLDVQDDQVSGLDDGDEELLRSLANQLAVAIRNARLFEEVAQSLMDARALQTQYTEENWQSSPFGKQAISHAYQRMDVVPLEQTKVAKFVDMTSDKTEPTILTEDAYNLHEMPTTSNTGVMIAPIRLQQQTIGAIQLHETTSLRNWDQEEIAFIQAISDQVAQTAENLRLFEETRQKASQEQVIREITEKIRQAASLDQLVKITTEELGQYFSTDIAMLNLGSLQSLKEPLPQEPTSPIISADHHPEGQA
ncbi:MAG: GAF domain-containing protein [Chloroflexota bacterium]